MYFIFRIEILDRKRFTENPHGKTKNEIENSLVVVQMHSSILLISQLKCINLEKEDGNKKYVKTMRSYFHIGYYI